MPAGDERGDVRRAGRARALAELPEPLVVGGVAGDDRAGERVRVAGQVLRRRVQDEVGAVLERPEVDGSGRGRVDDDPGRMGSGRLEVGHRQERVRRRLQPDQVGAVGRRAGLVELDVLEPPAAELVHDHAGAEVARPRRARPSGPARAARAAAPSRRPSPEANRSACPSGAPSSARELPLGLDSGRVRVARVDELARLAVDVRPDASPVDAHRGEVTGGLGPQLLEPPHPRELGEDLDRGERDPDRRDPAARRPWRPRRTAPRPRPTRRRRARSTRR